MEATKFCKPGIPLFRKVLREFGRPFARRKPPRRIHDEPQWIHDIVDRVNPFTMTSHERIAALCNATEYIIRSDIPGSFVECGVWRGGSIMAAALTLLRLERADRELYLFDTFSGMTPPTDVDRRRIDGAAASDVLADLFWTPASKEDVIQNLAGIGYPMSRVHLVEGRVEDTIPTSAPLEIALLRLDTDWYESTRHELIHLYPRLASRGVLIIDDYGCWDGSKLAFDEYLAEKQLPIFLNRIDEEGRLAIKP
jgi:O-methyltransferase